MLRRTPLKRSATKREKPGFPPKLPAHRRQKQAARAPNAAEKRHMDRLAQWACIACGERPVHLHHVMKAEGKQMRRDHRYVVPLCPDCHQGPLGVHGLGSEARFEEYWSVPSLAIAARTAWEASEAMEAQS